MLIRIQPVDRDAEMLTVTHIRVNNERLWLINSETGSDDWVFYWLAEIVEVLIRADQ